MLKFPLGAALLALFLFAATTAHARSVLLYGGAASTRYLYTGEQRWSTFYELASHDLRFRGGGVLWHDRNLSSSELTTAVFAGVELSLNVPGLRMPVGTLQHAEIWRLLPSLELDVEANATVQPATIAEGTAGQSAQVNRAPGTSSVAGTGIVGRPLLLLDGGAEAFYRHRRELLALRAGYGALIHFGQINAGDEEVQAAGAFQVQATWDHQVTPVHHFIARPLYRSMFATTNTLSPVTGLAGAMAGWGLRLRELAWQITALGGIGYVVNLPRSHLLPVEPLISVEALYRERWNTLSIVGGWSVRENPYAAGLPMRVIEARVGWEQPLSSRRWRGAAEIGYERLRLGHFGGGESRPADTPQAVRLQGLIICSMVRGWRLFAEAALAVGHTDRAIACESAALCPAYGFSMSTLIGVAYINATRVADERVLDQRVMNLVR